MRALALLPSLLILSSACAPGPRQPHELLPALRAGLSSDIMTTRARAAWDLGQLGFVAVPEGTNEPETSVTLRREAAEALLPLVLDPEPPVRRAAVEALGKLGGAELEEALLSAGTDIDAGVRGETALALFRRRHLKRVPEYSTSTFNRLAMLASDPDPEVRWRAIYAFTRFADPRAEGIAAKAQNDTDKVARLFAVRSLAKLGRSADLALLSDPDPYVRAEAVASFGAAKKAELLPAAVFNDASAHVRAAVADAVAATGRAELAGHLEKMADSDSAMPRGRALLALAKLRGDAQAPRLERARKDAHWWVRSKAYEASASLKDGPAIVDAGVRDADARVSSQALETLAASTSPLAAVAIERVLRDEKSSLELLGTAIDAAGERKDKALAPALRAAAARKDLTAEIGDSLKKALKACGDDGRYAGPKLADPKVFPPLTASPTIVLKTEKGDVELLLDAALAPNHAAAIAAEVRKGVYDGTIWHRVVTAFVVQGGDPRGSGWGDDGYRLADENSPAKFLRGTLGMPKAGPDTGGCQLFVSLIPTPHLDGRYTAFGRVLSGMDVLDRLEPGDLILSARLR